MTDTLITIGLGMGAIFAFCLIAKLGEEVWPIIGEAIKWIAAFVFGAAVLVLIVFVIAMPCYYIGTWVRMAFA